MKPFTGVHFYRHGEKPAEGKEDTLAIVQVGRGPAHYVVQVVTSYQDGTNFDISILNRLGRGSWMWVVVETISYTPFSSFCTGEIFSSQDPAPNHTNLQGEAGQSWAAWSSQSWPLWPQPAVGARLSAADVYFFCFIWAVKILNQGCIFFRLFLYSYIIKNCHF